MASDGVRIVPRFRVYSGEEIALGPGKADLLESIGTTGSIARAAKALGMSYARAWRLVATMNACFRSPLVASERGGNLRGGARLTERGETVLRTYRALEERSLRAASREIAALRKHLA